MSERPAQWLYPEGAVEDGEPRPGPPPGEGRELLAQGEVPATLLTQD